MLFFTDGSWRTRRAVMISSVTVQKKCAYVTEELAFLCGHNIKNSKQIIPEKELCGISTNFHIHVSVSDSYIPKIGLPALQQEIIWPNPGNL